jgi:hypothetical protein
LNEIRALKRIGFSDESLIIGALKQTSRNVNRAVKLLMRHPPGPLE